MHFWWTQSQRSALSLLTKPTSPSRIPAHPWLQSIKTYGSKPVSLQFGKQTFTWLFVVAKTLVAILGADFLLGHALAVDLKRRCLFW